MERVSHPAISLNGWSSGLAILCLHLILVGQAPAQDTPQSRMRPIGSTRLIQNQQTSPTAYTQGNTTGSAVRQVVMMQDTSGQIVLPGNPPNPATRPGTGITPGVPNAGVAQPTPNVSAAPLGQAPTLPTPGATVPNASDYAPIPQPQLATAYATVDNCNLVTPASGYSASFANQCGNQAIRPQGYLAPTGPSVVAPLAQPGGPAVLPPNRQAGAPLRSIVTLGQETNRVQVGQGLWGQPKAYVVDQPVRNWVRYFFP